MALAETTLLLKHLDCSICLQMFDEPVTTVCGHSFCKKCLDYSILYTDHICPLCKTHLTKTPDVNIVLRDIVQQQKEKSANFSLFTGEAGQVACDVCTDQKLQAEKSCLVCLNSYCSAHLENHCKVERLKSHKLVAPLANLDHRACLKHGRPLELYSRKEQRCICVQCMKEDSEDIVSTEDEWEEKKVKIGAAKEMVETKVKMRESQLDEIHESLRSFKKQMESEWWDIDTVFNTVIEIVEEAQRSFLLPLGERRQVVVKEAKKLKQQLKAEIGRFKKTISELDDLAKLEDHIQFLQNYPSLKDLDDISDRAEVKFDTSLCFGTLRGTTATMMERVQQKLEQLTSTELKRVAQFAADVKLDSASAHQRLVVSDDGKEVKDGGKNEEADDSPERFDIFGSVLGVNSLTSGRSYWEVEVSNKSGWDLGVARGDANRRGKLSLNPESGYWVIVHYEDEKYAALTAPPVRLLLKRKPQTVGVFVDYEEGLVSFYDVTARSHIYSFTKCSFRGKIFPYFSPHVKQGDKNIDPLIISPVKAGEQDESRLSCQ